MQSQSKTNVTVRPAIETDAQSAVDVVRRSITELCVVDHRNDDQTLLAWLENKTEANFQRWIKAESNYCVVAELETAICGFAHINRLGKVGLLYVTPEARFLGASKLMLQELEAEAVRRGLRQVYLHSSLTALSFYEARGYTQTAEAVPGYGVTHGFPMVKKI